MKYNQPRDIKKVFAVFLNKIFSLNEKWFNEDIEVVSLSGQNSPNVFEQYPWNKEKYPLVVVFAEGSSDDQWAIDSRIGNYWTSLLIGQTPRSYVELLNPIAFGVTPGVYPLTLRSVDLAVQYKGPYEEDITVKLWSISGSYPNQVLASGSIKGKSSTQMEWATTIMYPQSTVLEKGINYFISVETEDGSYYLMLDTDVDASITPWARYTVSGSSGWSTIDATKTALARVNGPVFYRIGGGQENRIRIFVESKDLPTTQKITELIYLYLHLIKHSNPQRKVKMDAPNESGMDYDFVSDLTDQGIYIIDVDKGSETVRNRGNDRLFSIDLIITCYGSWVEDFSLPTLDDINIEDVSGY